MSSVRRGKASRACASSDSEKRRWVQPEEKVLVVIWSPVRPWKTYLLYTLLGRLRGIQRERTIRFRVVGRPKVACALIDDQRGRLCENNNNFRGDAAGGGRSIRWGTLRGLVKKPIRVDARIRVRWRQGNRGCKELFLIYRDSLWGYWVGTAASTFELVAGSLFSCRLPPHLSKCGACKM